MPRTIGQLVVMFPLEHEWIFVFGKNKKKLNCTIKNKGGGEINNHVANRQKDGKTLKIKTVVFRDKRELGTVLTMQQLMARNMDTSHPASFPVAFPEEYIKAITKPKEIVVEPFCGSGSTLIACEKTNRRCFSMEIDSAYCDIVLQRYKDFTGEEPIREDETKFSEVNLESEE